MTTQSKPLFMLGQIVATTGALDALLRNVTTGQEYLRLHASGNWGLLSDEDKRANQEALNSGARILSAYLLSDETKIWIITDAADDSGKRRVTTILLPEDY